MKTNIFGLNGARVYALDVESIARSSREDRLGTMKRTFQERPNPSFETHGPQTRREFFALLEASGGRPG